MTFLNNELHIILKSRNLEICKHSSFLVIDENVFESNLKFRHLKIITDDFWPKFSFLSKF